MLMSYCVRSQRRYLHRPLLPAGGRREDGVVLLWQHLSLGEKWLPDNKLRCNLICSSRSKCRPPMGVLCWGECKPPMREVREIYRTSRWPAHPCLRPRGGPALVVTVGGWGGVLSHWWCSLVGRRCSET